MTKTVIITGASRGIGFAALELFLEKGWNVAGIARTQATLDKATAALKQQYPTQLLALAADTGDEAAFTAAFEKAVAHFGGVDSLINNAAILIANPFEKSTAAEWQETFRVNVMGVMHGCQLAFKHMRGKGGSIVNIASVAGLSGVEKFPGISSYAVSKYAVVGITEALAAEAPRGIRINCVAPAATDTEMLQQAAPGLQTDTKPRDVAQVIYYYADSALSGEISGEVKSLLGA